MNVQNIQRALALLILLCVFSSHLLFSLHISQTGTSTPLYTASKSPFSKLMFVKNEGQWDKAVQYRAIHNGSWLSFMDNKISFGTVRKTGDSKDERSVNSLVPNKAKIDSEYEALVWSMEFIKCDPDFTITPENPSACKFNYFIGNDPAAWQSEVPAYAELYCKNLYKGIDLRYYESKGDIKYDFIIQPLADIANIQLRYDGVRKISINKDEQLIIQTEWGEVMEEAPYAYQIIDGKKTEVSVSYLLNEEKTVGFKVGKYNTGYPLIIDPIILKWGTYIGPSAGNDITQLTAIDIDDAGNVYGVGATVSSNFPVTNSSVKTGTGSDLFLFKLSADGQNMLYATYIGGSSGDVASGIDVNKTTGEAYLTGYTLSTDFPSTFNAYNQTINPGGFIPYDSYFLKISSNGNTILYGTYIGGSDIDRARSVKIDYNNSQAVITGETFSADFPTGTSLGSGNVHDNTANGNVSLCGDIFVSRFSLNGNGSSDLVYSTYLGGDSTEIMTYTGSLAIDANGDVVVAATTVSADFPLTAGCFDNTLVSADGFVSKLRMNGNGTSDMLYSSFIGGSSLEFFQLVVIDGPNIILGGASSSTDYPVTTNAYKTFFGPGSNLEHVVCKLNPGGNGTNDLVYSTYLEAKTGSPMPGIAVNSKGDIYVYAYAWSFVSLPVTTCAYTTSRTPGAGDDMGIYKIRPAGNGAQDLLYCTYIESASPWGVFGVIDGMRLLKNSCGPGGDEIYIAANTHATDFPTTPSSFKPFKTGTETESCIAKFSSFGTVSPFFADSVCIGDPTIFSQVQCGFWDTLSYWWDFGDGSSVSTQPNPVHQYTLSGIYQVKFIVGSGSCIYDTIIKNVIVYSQPEANAGRDTTICQGNSVILNATGGNEYVWSTGASTASITISPSVSTTYSVTVYNGICVDIEDVIVNVSPFQVVDAGSNVDLISGGKVILNASGIGTYMWIPAKGLSCNNCKNPVAQPTVTTTYYLVVTDAAGCTATDSVTITVENKCGDFFIPTAFSPNGDGQNDIFLVRNNCIKEIMVVVYNRWGEKIFQSNDILKGWNGTNNEGELVNSAVFVYQLSAILTNGTLVEKTGNISLVR